MLSSTGATAMPPFSARHSTSRSYFALCSTLRTAGSSSSGFSSAIAAAKSICAGVADPIRSPLPSWRSGM